MTTFISDLLGTLSDKFRIRNVTLKDDSGTLHLRNKADSADIGAIVSAIKITTSPNNGYVLTSDGSGNGTWQAATGGSTDERLFWLGF